MYTLEWCNQLSSNVCAELIAYNNFSRIIFFVLYDGIFNKLKHVDADGNYLTNMNFYNNYITQTPKYWRTCSTSVPELRILNLGLSSLNPSNGGRGHPVTNLRNILFSSVSNSCKTSQNHVIVSSVSMNESYPAFLLRSSISNGISAPDVIIWSSC